MENTTSSNGVTQQTIVQYFLFLSSRTKNWRKKQQKYQNAMPPSHP